jgi:hypothetical protein
VCGGEAYKWIPKARCQRETDGFFCIWRKPRKLQGWENISKPALKAFNLKFTTHHHKNIYLIWPACSFHPLILLLMLTGQTQRCKWIMGCLLLWLGTIWDAYWKNTLSRYVTVLILLLLQASAVYYKKRYKKSTDLRRGLSNRRADGRNGNRKQIKCWIIGWKCWGIFKWTILNCICNYSE